MAENNAPSIISFERVLSTPVPGTGLTISGLLLSIFAILGSIPVIRTLFAGFIAEPLMLGVVSLVVAALVVYYLLVAESHSEWLKKHPIAFIVIVIALMLAAYNYIPDFKNIFGVSGETVGQLATLLIRP